MTERFKEVNLVFNPAANKGRAASRRKEISYFLESRKMKPVWHITEGPGHAVEITAGLQEGALVVAVGGDGTVHEVASVCAGTDRVMGVLPVGSGNDYIKALGIGSGLSGALEALAGGKVRTVDTGIVNGVLFNNMMGIGFDAQVAAGVIEAPWYLGGFGRYMWSVLRLLWRLRCHEATLSLDGGPAMRIETVLIAVALGTTTGACFRLAPRALLDDGLFDVVWSEKVSRAEVLRLIPKALDGTLPEHPKVHTARAWKVEVELAEEVPAHVDGEILPPTRFFYAGVIPGALRVVAS